MLQNARFTAFTVSDLELITVFTDTRVGYVANNVDVDDGG